MTSLDILKRCQYYPHLPLHYPPLPPCPPQNLFLPLNCYFHFVLFVLFPSQL